MKKNIKKKLSEKLFVFGTTKILSGSKLITSSTFTLAYTFAFNFAFTLIFSTFLFVQFFNIAIPQNLSAEIIQTTHFNELNKYIQDRPLIILDIDNTLIEPVQELGSDQWFYHQMQEYASHGMSKEVALEKALREWTAIQSITKVKLCEEGTDKVIENLQMQGFPIIGLSTRGLGISTRTVEQLESVGIDLTKTSPTQEEIFFMNERGVLFRGGILFTAATHKGTALMKLLERIPYKPSSIVFVNDKYSHIVPLEEVCAKEKIPFVGLRYGYTDKKVKNFRRDIAEVQFHMFGHIISDEAAERMLHCSY